MAKLDCLFAGAQSLGILLTGTQLEQFENYQHLLQEWNQRINLTSTHDIEFIQERHFLDSLFCVLATGPLNGQTLIDVGSGAGFPGIPLKICFPDLELTLLESIRKKGKFLQAVVDTLDLTAVSVCIGRAEGYGQMIEHRESYDWAVARAVAPLRVLSEYLLPLVHIHGYALAQKGQGARDELVEAEGAITRLGGGAAELIPIHAAGQDQPPYLVRIPKIVSTPEQYPRRIGVPTKRPL